MYTALFFLTKLGVANVMYYIQPRLSPSSCICFFSASVLSASLKEEPFYDTLGWPRLWRSFSPPGFKSLQIPKFSHFTKNSHSKFLEKNLCAQTSSQIYAKFLTPYVFSPSLKSWKIFLRMALWNLEKKITKKVIFLNVHFVSLTVRYLETFRLQNILSSSLRNVRMFDFLRTSSR